MDGLTEINLKNLVYALGENEAGNILASFSCPKNKDLETFLHEKAIVFATQGITQTHLVFASFREKPALVAYYSLTYKTILVKKACVSAKTARRVARYGRYSTETGYYEVPAPLIAQLGKNFANNYNLLISGDILLTLACEKVKKVQDEVGGRIVYLECEDIPALKDLYERNGFCNFGKRNLDKDEKDLINGEYLIQMLKYLG